MSDLRFTRDAEADILSIHDYTLENFGGEQWTNYEIGLHTAFENIRSNPLIGSDCGRIRPGTRRLIFRSHVIYYRVDPDSLLVLRIIGVRQDPGRHL